MKNKEKAISIVEAFETGSSKVLEYVSNEKYIQHNLSFPDGKNALVGFFTNSPTGITIKIHRVIEDGDRVVIHSTYGGDWNHGTPQVAFDVFRFENGLMVEHWDNLLDVTPLNASGRSQIDGSKEVKDLVKTDTNRKVVTRLMNEAFLGNDYSKIAEMISPTMYLQHNPQGSDGLEGFNQFVAYLSEQNIVMSYKNSYQIIVEGNFAITLADGTFGGEEMAYYDLFRLEDGLIVEHWDVVAAIPDKSEWKNQNGKF